MKEKAVMPLVISMAIPMTISMLVNSLYNIIDSFYVAKISEQAMTALSLVYPAQNLLTAVTVGFAIGVNAVIAYYLGAGLKKLADTAATLGLIFNILHGFLIGTICIVGMPAFLGRFSSDSEIIHLGTQYANIVFLFGIPIGAGISYEKTFQAIGRMKVSMVSMLVGCVVNIILDPVMIYGIGPVPEMGVAGAAYATVIGQVISAVLLFVFHMKLNKEFEHDFTYMKPDVGIIREIYAIGLPAIIAQALMSIMVYAMNLILKFDPSAQTAYGLFYKIQQFVFFASFGMNNTIIPVVSYNYGKGDKTRVRSGIKYGMLYTLGLMLLGIIGLQLFASQICHVFSLSADTEIFATYAIRIITLGYLFAGANIAYQGIFQALDHGIASLVLSLIRLLVIPLPTAYLLTLTSSAGKIVWAAIPFGELVGTVAAIVIMGRIKREIKLKD